MKNNKVTQKTFKEDFEALTRLVNEWDPIMLIRGGAPPDEYSCLVSKTLSRLYAKGSYDELEQFLVDELEDHFGWGGRQTNDRLKYFCIQARVWYRNESLHAKNSVE